MRLRSPTVAGLTPASQHEFSSLGGGRLSSRSQRCAGRARTLRARTVMWPRSSRFAVIEISAGVAGSTTLDPDGVEIRRRRQLRISGGPLNPFHSALARILNSADSPSEASRERPNAAAYPGIAARSSQLLQSKS